MRHCPRVASAGSYPILSGINIACLVLFLVAVACPSGRAATIYYVDAASGDDGFSGTSATAAWKTIKKVNNRTFVPGDQVLFKRGETWHESLVVPSSGNSDQPITFGAYGSGNPPRLDGTYPNSPIPVQWEQVQVNIYRSTSPTWNTDPGLLIYKGAAKPAITTLSFSNPVPGSLKNGAILLQTDGTYTSFQVTSTSNHSVSGITLFTIQPTKNVYVRQLNADGREETWPDTLGTPTVITSPAGLTKPGHWYWNEQERAVYLYSDTYPNPADVKISLLDMGIYTNGKSNLNIRDITVHGFRDLGIFIRGTRDSVVQNMHVENIGARIYKTGILLNRANNNLIDGNTVKSALRVGIGLYGEPASPYCNGNSISGNIISNTGSSGISLNTDAPGFAYAIENNRISDNTITTANSLVYDSAGIYTLFVGGGNIIRSNTVRDGGSVELRSAGIMIEGGNDPAIRPLTVENNIIENNSLAGIAVSGKEHRITGNTLRNNGAPSWENAQLMFYTAFGENASSCTVEENTMEAGSNQKLVSVFNGLGSTSPPHTVNYNTYCTENSTPFCWSGWTCNTPLDFISWQNQSGQDGDSVYFTGSCVRNSSPSMPNSPTPSHRNDQTAVATFLSWSGGDPDPEDSVTYDVYLDAGNAIPATLICDDISSTTCRLKTDLAYGTTYFWKVVAKDSQGQTASSPTWSFTTIPQPDFPWNLFLPVLLRSAIESP